MGGGATKREGGGGQQVKFYRYEKGGELFLAMLNRGGGGANKFWGSISAEA